MLSLNCLALLLCFVLCALGMPCMQVAHCKAGELGSPRRCARNTSSFLLWCVCYRAEHYNESDWWQYARTKLFNLMAVREEVCRLCSATTQRQSFCLFRVLHISFVVLSMAVLKVGCLGLCTLRNCMLRKSLKHRRTLVLLADAGTFSCVGKKREEYSAPKCYQGLVR